MGRYSKVTGLVWKVWGTSEGARLVQEKEEGSGALLLPARVDVTDVSGPFLVPLHGWGSDIIPFLTAAHLDPRGRKTLNVGLLAREKFPGSQFPNFQHQFLILLEGNRPLPGDLELWILGVGVGESKENMRLIRKDSVCPG